MAVAAFSEDDKHFMRVALSLSKRGLGIVWPNPSVGCVIIRGGEIVGRGWTQKGGRPHAERMALAMAGDRASGASVYVTLEPCSHHGVTPPCARGLIEAGVGRVVSALEDPDPRVAGRGHQMLRDAGIRVDVGLMDDEARRINAGFLSRITQNRPLVTLKLAATLDGRSALANGQSQWITGAQARNRGHMLRATHDAILVGADTVLADDPDLTCRIAGIEDRSPVRIILDRTGKVGTECKLVQTATQTPTWLVTSDENTDICRNRFANSKAEVIAATCDANHLDLKDVLHRLADKGVTRILIESGGRLAAGFIRAGLVDRIVHFSAPGFIGAEGLPVIGDLMLDDLVDMPRYHRADFEKTGEDFMITYEKETE
ncbi:bifunctional diaminohydroxyphosphoribosylaminopyrimidine deaminase/5-amino-6-(5-phosphoribosylamino)uracil reductase RibD [Thalassospira sp.]|uniref:bifunctional diaminohydroxyphosphoribosylaminopyrimidine deaminase/5-amino-6-(5-phosphoribosylamino)uracil reductase RibD n=1 Tax=Thalassospira sp. TaxID=1912094 RepID=UPI0027337287|nr:bifunctional diaminohydroxyphosphoribosylaminopyrimidine deaminase/5-amino-6-(5-phosphoribosylamino)uracil reductase RibD [Thalassospira sp.]MDP2697867.1 bifunctional diaminohydroxyphosphoribosylaminopyrimidine deaminase/5-amino-6-(5-phosphoribosylamino)uracil reductase RibD [Thalassospira sp.]